MKFALRDGHWTDVVFYHEDGKIRAFPEENLKLVQAEGTDESKSRLNFIFGLEEDPLDFIAVEVSQGKGKHGGFLRTFAMAWQLAMPDNKVLLREVWKKLIEKYNLDDEFLKEVQG